MGSGASAGASTPTLPWPEGATVVLRPDGALPDGLKTSGPVPSTESGVPFWRLGGAGKGRLRVIEDTAGLLELKENFTIAVCFRPGAGDAQGWDSLLLGHAAAPAFYEKARLLQHFFTTAELGTMLAFPTEDNKHWLAMPGCMDGDSSLNLNADFLDQVDAFIQHAKLFRARIPHARQGWIQIFLRSVEGGTSVFGMDQEGLLDLGTFPTSLVGSKLRNAGWATNEVDIAAIAFWDRILTWAELSPPAPAPAPAPPPAPDAPIPKRIFGQVTDLAGEPLKDVSIKWKMGGCISDGEGSFAMLEEAETDVPEDMPPVSVEVGLGVARRVGWMEAKLLLLRPPRVSASSDGWLDGWPDGWMDGFMDSWREGDGFAPTSMRISVASEQSIVVALRKLSATATLDASWIMWLSSQAKPSSSVRTEGGQVVDPSSGSSVTAAWAVMRLHINDEPNLCQNTFTKALTGAVPPSSLVYADGSPVTGPVTVQVSLSVIDATDPASLASMPGSRIASKVAVAESFLAGTVDDPPGVTKCLCQLREVQDELSRSSQSTEALTQRVDSITESIGTLSTRIQSMQTLLDKMAAARPKAPPPAFPAPDLPAAEAAGPPPHQPPGSWHTSSQPPSMAAANPSPAPQGLPLTTPPAYIPSIGASIQAPPAASQGVPAGANVINLNPPPQQEDTVTVWMEGRAFQIPTTMVRGIN
ncbi:hypothetical protein AK812_SmicGene6302 [Symbiodinium microadriaticum]|uniref:Uncharacterized protein n=1 Tax=Symbiodinium microadriaticum TaxID=2951 RepID=A0A1Q9ERI4_SYMMI|nr:hypothetical protein AK812_SmicGene6302 [Symbiodinium microadriaticum]